MIVLLNVDDEHGGVLADILMPGADWQVFRDQGQVPFARGLAERAGIQSAVESLDVEAGAELAAIQGEAAVVVMDFGVVGIFRASEAKS